MAFFSDTDKGYQVQLSWSGFQEFEDLLTEIEDIFGEKDSKQILKNAGRIAMKPVLEKAKSLLASNGNIDTGQLYQSLQIEARKPTGKDKRSAYVESSMIMIARVTVAPGHKYLPDKKSKLRSKTFKNRITGKREHMHSDARAFAIEFGTARWLKGEGHPFLRPALESNSRQITDSLTQSLRTAMFNLRSKHMKTK
jgi:hypothetical protein